MNNKELEDNYNIEKLRVKTGQLLNTINGCNSIEAISLLSYGMMRILKDTRESLIKDGLYDEEIKAHINALVQLARELHEMQYKKYET